MPVGGNPGMGFPLISNLSLSSLILTRPQKSPNSFDFFEKDLNFDSDRTMQEGVRQVGRTSRRKQLIASKLPSSKRRISVTYKVIVQLILPWLCSRSPLHGTLETISPTKLWPKFCWLGIFRISQPKKLWPSTSPHIPHTHILYGPTIAV